MKKITSRDNPRFKELRALASDSRKQRLGGSTLIDGPHLVESYRLAVGPPRILAVSDSGLERPEIIRLLDLHAGIETLQLPDVMFRELSGTVAPVGILAIISIPPSVENPVSGSCIVLDGIQDSGNVGAILRTAAAAGIRDAIFGPGCAYPWAPKVLRAGQGAHFHLSIREHGDLPGFIQNYKGKSLATVARDGQPLFDMDLRGNLAWIFGSEGGGVNSELLARTDQRVAIPMADGSESLNVTAAAAICLFEAVRQNRL